MAAPPTAPTAAPAHGLPTAAPTKAPPPAPIAPPVKARSTGRSPHAAVAIVSTPMIARDLRRNIESLLVVRWRKNGWRRQWLRVAGPRLRAATNGPPRRRHRPTLL